ncbi:hypothetical protein BC477_07935 [Clavibacter michiganensis subsp. michiganensis]|uniref:Uncharacterized protein n=1 Tax=Clavibacter michiganensis subsp. michiganensis TaxID=33013 RepID=A0A251XMM5_CLAMM|nr:hypothetical protein BC477_07935 [Clavibacter michiganensis subsp. michiganensis]OUE04650.1 hypothetical protein CMMCAS07_06865 [Clavibacter michiganensis subsp. michiganensis]
MEMTDCCAGNCAPPEKKALSAAVPFAATVLCCRYAGSNERSSTLAS